MLPDVIVPDVPFEEKEEVRGSFAEQIWTGSGYLNGGTDLSTNVCRMIAKEAEGFVYCVSSLGVTGMRSRDH